MILFADHVKLLIIYEVVEMCANKQLEIPSQDAMIINLVAAGFNYTLDL